MYLAKSKQVKKKSNLIKNFITEFLEKSAITLLSLIENFNVGNWVKDVFHLKEKIRKYVIISVFSITASVVFMLGIASYLASKFPALGNGVSEILIGLVLAIIALIYYKQR